MYTGLLHLHNVLRWVILILLIVALFQAITKKDGIKKSSLWLLIAAHTTFLIGLYQWIAGPWGLKNIQNLGMGEVMKNTAMRFWAVEHFSMMILAVILITVARKKAKLASYSAAMWLYFVALVLILAAVPWPFREAIARPLFPGM